MFNYPVVLTLVLIFSVTNAHLIKNFMHKLHDKHHHHNKIYTHYGPGRFPPTGPPPFGHFEQFPPFEPPPLFGFPPLPPHHSCHSCNHPYPSTAYNPHIAPNYPQMSFGHPSTININNLNANSQQDTTSVSSKPTNINTNVNPQLNFPSNPVDSNGPSRPTNSPQNSQGVFGENQMNINNDNTKPLDPGNVFATSNNNANPSTAIGNNPNVQPTNINGQVSPDILNQFGSKFNNFLNGASTLFNSMSSPATMGTTPVPRATNNDDKEYKIDVRFGGDDK